MISITHPFARIFLQTAGFLTGSLLLTILPARLSAQTTVVKALSPASQSINHHTAPASLSVSESNTSVTYQWQSASIDKEISWQPIPGATSSTYSPGVLDSTTCYRVKVSTGTNNFYWARGVVNVLPGLGAGRISPASQTVAYDAVPSTLAVTTVNGGDGNYTYQWYSSTDNLSWTPMSVYTPEYIPGGMEQTTWYRVLVRSNGMTATGIIAVVNVNPKTGN